jgi:hypothetical protein
MPDVSSVVKIILRIARDVWSTRTCKRKHTHLSITYIYIIPYTPPAQIKQTLYTQPGVSSPTAGKQTELETVGGLTTEVGGWQLKGSSSKKIKHVLE